jgi:hypothetical protein
VIEGIGDGAVVAREQAANEDEQPNDGLTASQD